MEMDISLRDVNGLQFLPVWMGVRGRESKSVQVSFVTCRWPGVKSRPESQQKMYQRAVAG